MTAAVIQVWCHCGQPLPESRRKKGEYNSRCSRCQDSHAKKLAYDRWRELHPSVHQKSWTEERVALLKQFWLEGLSASQCARQIGGFENCVDGGRSAVIGKIHRLGLAGRQPGTRRKLTVKKPKKAKTAKPAFRQPGNPIVRGLYEFGPEPFTPNPEIFIPVEERKALIDLEPGDCRFPIDRADGRGFDFCAREKVKGLPYCQPHATVCFQPPQPRKRAASEPTLSAGGETNDGTGEGGQNNQASRSKQTERV